MATAASLFIVLVALLHCYFLVLEMFLWDKPKGMKTFKNSPAQAAATKVLAANQGLYNGFLAAGLFYGLWLGEAGFSFKVFFLLCVIVAGAYGAYSVNKRIFFVQSMPAVVALVLLYLSKTG
jgi:putative membrane protein